MMLKKITTALDSHYARSIAVLFSGNAAAQIILLLSLPFLTRIYSPEVFGQYGTFMALVSLFAGVAAFRYEQAVVICEGDEEESNLVSLAVILSIVTAVVVSFVLSMVYFFKPDVVSYIHPLMIIIGTGFVIFLRAVYGAFEHYLIRKKYFNLISKVVLLQSVVMVVLQLSLGYLDAYGLILGNLIAVLISSCIVYHKWKRREAGHVPASVNGLRMVSQKYKDFPLYNMPQGFLNSFTQNSPVFILMWFSGPVAAGAYTLAIRLLQRPAELVTKPVRQVFFQKSTELWNTDRRKTISLYRQTILALALVSVGPTLIVFIWGSEMASIVFGERWRLAGELSRWLILMVGVKFINAPAYVIARVLRVQDRFLVAGLLGSVAALTSLLIGTLVYGGVTGIAVYCVVTVVFNLILVGWMDSVLVRQSQV